jgi:hypothetical protein
VDPGERGLGRDLVRGAGVCAGGACGHPCESTHIGADQIGAPGHIGAASPSGGGCG